MDPVVTMLIWLYKEGGKPYGSCCPYGNRAPEGGGKPYGSCCSYANRDLQGGEVNQVDIVRTYGYPIISMWHIQNKTLYIQYP